MYNYQILIYLYNHEKINKFNSGIETVAVEKLRKLNKIFLNRLATVVLRAHVLPCQCHESP